MLIICCMHSLLVGIALMVARTVATFETSPRFTDAVRSCTVLSNWGTIHWRFVMESRDIHTFVQLSWPLAPPSGPILGRIPPAQHWLSEPGPKDQGRIFFAILDVHAALAPN